MLCIGVVSGRRLSLNDVNYDNSNTNVSPHFAKNISSIDLAGSAKNKSVKNGLW